MVHYNNTLWNQHRSTMKLIFKLYIAERCSTNNGIVYRRLKDVPFKIGDYVEFKDPYSIKFFGDGYENKLLKVLSMKLREDSNPNKQNVLLCVDKYSSSFCCSWITPVKPIWRQL